jgi:FkbM family methyltransferase
MISQAKKLALGSIQSTRAIIEGEYFSSSLQNQLAILESLQKILERLEGLERAEAGSSEQVGDILKRLKWLEFQLGNSKMKWSSPTEQNLPENRLIQFIFPRLTDTTILDVGAHRGTFTDWMLKIGSSSVYAFEPHPELAENLVKKYASDARVTVLPVGVSDSDSEMELNLVRKELDSSVDADPLLFSSLVRHNMPEGLEFFSTTPVTVRSLESLVREGRIPQTAGILKVDAEGHDLAIFKGMPDGAPYEMLMSEFWSEDFVFATPGIPTQLDIFNHVRSLGYRYSLSILRINESGVHFIANSPVETSQTWGNTIYFRDQTLFDAAFNFLQNLLPQTF